MQEYSHPIKGFITYSPRPMDVGFNMREILTSRNSIIYIRLGGFFYKVAHEGVCVFKTMGFYRSYKNIKPFSAVFIRFSAGVCAVVIRESVYLFDLWYQGLVFYNEIQALPKFSLCLAGIPYYNAYPEKNASAI